MSTVSSAPIRTVELTPSRDRMEAFISRPKDREVVGLEAP